MTSLGYGENREIYCVDSFKFLSTQATNIEEGQFGSALRYQTIVTSPRYNCGKDYGCGISDKTPRDTYLLEMRTMGELLFRVSADTCVFFLNVGDDADWPDRSYSVMKEYEAAGWNLVQTIIWTKHMSGRGHFQAISGEKRLNPLTENIFMLVKNKKAYSLDRLAIGAPYTDKSNIKRRGHTKDLRCAGNLWFIPYDTVGKTIKKGHPAPFPVELAKKCILLNGCKGPVLDPFAGILSTARACESLAVPYTMLELSKEAIDIGKGLILSDRAK